MDDLRRRSPAKRAPGSYERHIQLCSCSPLSPWSPAGVFRSSMSPGSRDILDAMQGIPEYDVTQILAFDQIAAARRLPARRKRVTQHCKALAAPIIYNVYYYHQRLRVRRACRCAARAVHAADNRFDLLWEAIRMQEGCQSARVEWLGFLLVASPPHTYNQCP